MAVLGISRQWLGPRAERALLPMPTEKFDHPFGLAHYGLTYSGYQMLLNSLRWKS